MVTVTLAQKVGSINQKTFSSAQFVSELKTGILRVDNTCPNK